MHCSKAVWNASLTVAFRTSLRCSIKPVTLFIPCSDQRLYSLCHSVLPPIHSTSLNSLSHLSILFMRTAATLCRHHLLWISAITSNRSLVLPHSWQCSQSLLQCTDLIPSLHCPYRPKLLMCRTQGCVWPWSHLTLRPNLTSANAAGAFPQLWAWATGVNPLSWEKWTSITHPLPHTTYKN